MVKKEVSRIRNRCKRREVHAKVKAEKKKVKKSERTKRQREALELGDEAPPKQVRGTTLKFIVLLNQDLDLSEVFS
jgi:ribosome production factor 1